LERLDVVQLTYVERTTRPLDASRRVASNE